MAIIGKKVLRQMCLSTELACFMVLLSWVLITEITTVLHKAKVKRPRKEF